ncbi:DUF1579 domain-containing protein [Dyella tabacisoli]|uniref:DUF1579 domain-containing protein n=2 Tax=Dyella tabacisoli TaxID=2282381 RepID=A0A369URE4_9GAMM|nr:DUF1579 domain-containing protein [Dyella tabacisoli]
MTLGHASTLFAEDLAKPSAGGTGPEHDFDFFLGNWHVKHRRLKQRLVGNHDWEEFDGTSHCLSLLGGIVNLNETVVNRANGTYRGMGLRAFDAKTGNWADWYLDGRDPTQIDAPGTGRFANGVGTFLSEETYEGKPVTSRGLFTPITPSTCQWEQAYSTDHGKTWETNWVMRYTRMA